MNETTTKAEAAPAWGARGIPRLAKDHDVSGAFLRLEIARGRLRPTRLGRRIVIMRKDWERYLAQGRGDD